MRSLPPRVLCLSALLSAATSACGAPGAGVRVDEGEVVAGTLDPAELPAVPVVFGPDGAHAYGFVEVPAGSRLQAAYALADAAARAELGRLLEVRVTALVLADVTDDRTDVRRRCLEHTRTALPGLTIAARGVRTSADGRTLRVAARLDLTPAAARALLAPVLSGPALDVAAGELVKAPAT